MKNKITIFTISSVLLISAFTLHSVYAQDFVPLGKLAQEYLLRSTENAEQMEPVDTKLTQTQIEKYQQYQEYQQLKAETTEAQVESQETEPIKTIDDIVVVNPDIVMRNAVTESIDTITKTADDLSEEKEVIIEEIKQSVKEDIDQSIIKIRRQTNQEAYELQKAVDAERTQLFENINQTINDVTLVKTDSIKDLRTAIDTSIQNIKTNLEEQAPEVEISFDNSQKEIQEKIDEFEEQLEAKREIIRMREGLLVYLDSDEDDISDYDEIYIYGTDPDNAFTIPGELNDGQKNAQGINPLSETLEKKNYQDPREDMDSFVSEAYKVEKVQFIKEEKTLVFEGVALPNSFVTLYVFSTPIIVTVQADVSGKWIYELEQELENGEHQMYVATVDTTGKIVARSNPILFTKTAEAASIGIVGSMGTPLSKQNFLKDNFILVTLAILITIVILAMMFVGSRRNLKAVVSELKNEVNT